MIEIVDIGASAVDGKPTYQSLLDARLARVVRFDPQIAVSPAECSNYCIADGEEHTLYVYAAPGLTSLLEIDSKALTWFPEMTEWAKLLRTERVKTKRLGEVVNVCDFLHMDCQGSELAVLQHAKYVLRNCCAIHTELSICPLYVNQPLMHEVASELWEQGFQPHHIVQVRRADSGQTVDIDMLFVRREPNVAQSSKIALILEHCYGQKAR